MEKQDILKAIKEIKEKSPSRNFTQTVDIILNLQYINIKKDGEKVDIFISLPHTKGKKPKICALIDTQLAKQAKELLDKVVLKDDFDNYKNNKKEIKKLAREYDYFIAQANLMTDIASIFGRYFAPKGKMPNPKAGCIVPPETNLEPLAKKLHNLIRLTTKNEPIIKAVIGNQNMKDEELADNAMMIYNSLTNLLPQHKNNIKSVFIKLSMGPCYKINEGIKIKENKRFKKKEKKVSQKTEKKKANKKEK